MTTAEWCATQRAAGIRSGQLDDALIPKAGERAKVDAIYTWNVPHFIRVAWPAIASRLRTP